MAAQLARGRRRAGKAHHILAGKMVEQVADPADDQLQRAVGQQAGLDHHAHRRLGQIACRTRRFDDRRHARDQSGGELFEHAPDGKIERIDHHRSAL